MLREFPTQEEAREAKMAAEFAGACGLQFAAELTDRNFEVILFLSSWGPFWGMRTHTRGVEVVLVVTGVSLAFVVRAILVAAIGDSDNTAGWALTGSTVISPLVLCMLAFRAWSDWKNVDALAKLNEARAKVIEEDKEQTQEKYDEAHREGIDKVAHTGFAKGRDHIDWAEMREPKALAFFIPFIITLFNAAANPLQGAQISEKSPWYLFLALVFGSIFAACLAVGLGTTLERWVSERRYLLCAWVSLLMSALGATCHAVLLFAYDVKGTTVA